MSDVLWFGGFALGLAGLAWIAYRMDPHMVSRAGDRFLCMGADLEASGRRLGRFRETWVRLLPDGLLLITQRRNLRRRTAYFRLTGVAPEPPRGKAVYVARSASSDVASSQEMLLLQLPATSKIRPTLDGLLSEGDRGTGSTAERPDRG